MKTRPAVPLVLLLSTFSLVSCDLALQDTKKTVTDLATAVNSEFLTVRKAQETLVAQITDLYDKIGTLDLSTKGMDASEGGLYDTFPGGKYYYKKRAEGSALYASPGRAVDNSIRKQVKFLEYVDPFLQQAGKATDIQATAFYGIREPITLALLNPWFDVISFLPPGIDLNLFEWYRRGLNSSGPSVWSEKPFTDLVNGWVMDLAAPVRFQGQVRGVAVTSVDLARVSGKYIKGQSIPVALMGPDTTVLGLSPQAKIILKISPLTSVDYLKQVKENTFSPKQYQLTDESHDQDIQSLGRRLLSEKKDFESVLDGKTYWISAQVVSENGIIVFGLTPR